MVSKRLKISDQEQYQKYYKFMQNYKPLNDYIKEKELSKDTKYKYYGTLAAYCCSQNEFFDKLMDEAQKEENSEIPLIERKLHGRLDCYESFLKEEGYTDKTIERKVKVVRSFYRRSGISLIEITRSLDINPECRKNIENSEIFKEFVVTLNLENDSTIGGYLTSLTGYCDYYDMTIEELIQEADDEEEANVRISKRNVKKRLIKYRKHLVDENYANSTIRTKMSDITYFYAVNDIEIPNLPKANYPYEPELSYEEIPTMEHIKRALETTTSIKNRALFLFCLTSGSSSSEARSFTISEYMAGTKECHGETTDIKKALEKMDGDLEFIPVFHLVRSKKKKDYYTCITPEANQFIINYLKTRDQLTLEDKVFDYSRKSLINAFQYVNDTNNWGWVNNNRQRMFTSHQLRRLNANIIDNGKLVHMIQGKKFDATIRAYFKQDPKKVRDKYRNEVRKLTVYEKYKVYTLTDENYAEMQEQISKKDEIIQNQSEQIKELTENQNNMDNTVKDLSERLKEMGKQLKHLDNESPRDPGVEKLINMYIAYLIHEPTVDKFDEEELDNNMFNDELSEFNKLLDNNGGLDELYDDYFKEYSTINREDLIIFEDEDIQNKIYNSRIGKQMRDFNREELLTIHELSYEIATNEIQFDGTLDSINKILKKSIFKMMRNPDLIIKVNNYYEAEHDKIQNHAEIFNLVNEKIEEMGLWEDEEKEKLKAEIYTYILQNKQYSYQEVNEEMIMDLIEKHI